MSFPVYFYEFTKKPNSTKRPPDSSAVEVTCDFWGTFDMARPVLKVELGMDVIAKYNYVQIPLWGKAYFVETYGWNSGHVTVTLRPDPMGTYRQFIMDRTQYVLRSNVSKSPEIIDRNYPSTIYREGVKVPIITAFSAAGVFVLAVAGMNGSKYYIMNATTLKNIMSFMFSQPQDNLWNTIVNAELTSLVKTFLNPFEYIRGCFWLPVAWDAYDTIEQVIIGYWNTNNSAGVAMPPQTKTLSYTISIPKNPAATGDKLFLMSPPFTAYQLIVPFCGTYALDASLLVNRTSLDIIMDIDVMGNIVGSVKAGDTILRFRGNCATELQLTDATVNVIKGAQSLVQTGASIAVGIPPVGAVTSAIDVVKPDVTSVGGSGGYAEIAQNAIELNAYFYDIAEQSTGVMGCPCYKNISPSAKGWYQCADAQIDFVTEMYEFEILKRYMDSGFWVE